ncbi:MAG: hypothetical protein M3007_06325 [Candidatus Eremiobacteraeota bacterium]|nr:hypothetical protein [Candidatus Eremiobacteraeota bacterium]
MLAIILGVLSAFTCIAAADPLKPGDALNYTFTTTYSVVQKPPVDPDGHMSVAEWAKVEVPKTSFPGGFTVTVDRLDADGSAHARISTSSKRGPSGPEFEATVTPDGQIVPKVDFAAIRAAGIDQNNPGAMIPTGYRSWTQAEQANFWAFVADRRLLLFNEVALGAGKKKAFKEGDAWRIVVPDQNNQIVDFVFQGTHQFQGRDVAMLGLTTTRTTKNGVGPVSGTAFYDFQRHLLVKLHVVGDDDTTLGVRNQTVDIVLQ